MRFYDVVVDGVRYPRVVWSYETPLAPLRHAQRIAFLAGVAADHANTGLRAFYYAIAALAWFFHPLLFILATSWVAAILIRREFFSRSYRIVADV